MCSPPEIVGSTPFGSAQDKPVGPANEKAPPMIGSLSISLQFVYISSLVTNLSSSSLILKPLGDSNIIYVVAGGGVGYCDLCCCEYGFACSVMVSFVAALNGSPGIGFPVRNCRN